MKVYKVTNLTNLTKKSNDLTFSDENGVSQLLKAGETKIYSFTTIPGTLRRVERLGFLLIELIDTINNYQSKLQETDVSVKNFTDIPTQNIDIEVEQIDDLDKKIKSKKK